MKVSSMIPCKGCTPWQGLLFTASILTCWHLSTTDRFAVQTVPLYVANGDSILFLVRNLPKNLLSFAWIKGRTSMNDAIIVYVPNINLSVPGRFHSGRETVYGNGSMFIQNVNQKDTGFYSLLAFHRHTDTVSQIGTYVYVKNILWTCGRLTFSPRPTIESVPPSVPHGGNVFLVVRTPPENMVGFIWYKWMNSFVRVEVGRYIVDKKSTELGPAYTGRETWYSDGTLLLRSVTQEESYCIQIQRTFRETEEITVKVQVDASLSVYCNPLTASPLMIQPVPQYPAEGENILFEVHNLPEDVKAFYWYIGLNTRIVQYYRSRNSVSWSPTYRKRGWMLYNNGSLMLQDVIVKDNGKYTLVFSTKHHEIEKAEVELHVNKSVTQPFVRITDTVIAGQRSVTFSCISRDTDISIRWIFNNQNLKLTESMTLSPTKCGLRIDSAKRENAGEYKCEVSNRFSSKTSPPVFWP
ncbi:pregnancy-specific glycoprotein 22-like [Peromyscus maniculatus bairdii]|uniref:pregnancy-specific glycoprotein 22-like n=1 Tax=Peromyscus maniculatus bairdii TaxID=230844 RepID=UPI003FD01E28